MNTVICPYCWQKIDIETPETLASGEAVEFVTDCEVCCRPIRITTTPTPGGPTEIHAEPES